MKRLFALLFVLMVSATLGCAGYRVGSNTMFPQHIRTVHVPVFDSVVFRSGLGEWLTEAVIKEIESRPGYKVVGRAQADTILEGRLITNTKRVLVEDSFDYPRETEVAMRVEVRWTDPQGQPLITANSIPFPDGLTEVVHDTSLVPEVGQSMATTQQKIIQQLAKQIVATMEVPW